MHKRRKLFMGNADTPMSQQPDRKRRSILFGHVIYDIQNMKIIYGCAITIFVTGILVAVVQYPMLISNILRGDYEMYQKHVVNALPPVYTACYSFLMFSYFYFVNSPFRPSSQKYLARNRERMQGSGMIYETLCVMPLRVTDVYRIQFPGWLSQMFIVMMNVIPANLLAIAMQEEYPVRNLLGLMNVLYICIPLLTMLLFFQGMLFPKTIHRKNACVQIAFMVLGISVVMFASTMTIAEELCFFVNDHISFGFYTGTVALVGDTLLTLAELALYHRFVAQNKHGITVWE